MVNLDKRRRVMQRSIQLGHCICDPKSPCPCETLREHDVCPCAGEELPRASGELRLTRLVQRAGCASKIDQAVLQRVLSGLPVSQDPRVLVGVAAGDDAGVFQFDGPRAWVQTVDVFTPVVDDAYTFGAIAAANSLSDIYAMGGEPLTALSIIGFPLRQLPESMLADLLRGGLDKMAEAGVAVIGGHSIHEVEVKAGFAVTGLVDPARMATNAGARPGDALVLTKPLGTGILAFAGQIERAPAGALAAAAESMAALNHTAARLMLELGAHACTDVTGFGLAGHLAAMASASGVDVELELDRLPLLPGVRECIAGGILPGGIERNRESVGQAFEVNGAAPELLEVCLDPQTSGGLLVCLSEADATAYVSRLHDAGVTCAAVIGHVIGRGTGRIRVRARERAGTAQEQWHTPVAPDFRVGARDSVAADLRVGRTAETSSKSTNRSQPDMDSASASCCGGHGEPGPQGVADAQRLYRDFAAAATRPGALDARTKQAIALALSVLARCEPCLKMHVRKAREQGFSQTEIDEAAWLGIMFGGSPAMAFYQQISKELLK